MARNDHFSAFAATYAEFRPTYPPALFAKIAELAPATEHAWDCATGNGQAAVSLTDHFGNITATDVGAAMIENAQPHPQVTYAVGSAEPPPRLSPTASMPSPSLRRCTGLIAPPSGGPVNAC